MHRWGQAQVCTRRGLERRACTVGFLLGVACHREEEGHVRCSELGIVLGVAWSREEAHSMMQYSQNMGAQVALFN